MKTYLTENGLLVVRPYQSFFTSNSGKFRRLATRDEVEYLVEQTGVMQVRPIWESEEEACYDKAWETMQKLATMKLPMWHYLWSVRSSNYQNYKPGTCSNGGDYSFHTSKHFFARQINGEWEIRSLTTHSTNAEFSYDELKGSFQSGLNYLTAVGVAPYELEDEHGKYQKENEWYFLTQTGSGEDEEIALDKLLDAETYHLTDAIYHKGYYIPEADSDEEEGFLPLPEEEIQRRTVIANNLGIAAPPKRRSSGRNHRRSS